MTVETGDDKGFRNRWELSAPESYALLYGPKDARQIFKLAVLELVARRHLELAEIEDPERSGRPRKYAVLRYGPNRGRPEGRPLEAVFSLFTGPVASPAGESQTEMAVPDLARSAMDRYGSFEGYVEACVMTALQNRNLFERRTRSWFWIFQTSRWEPTHSGEAAKAELRGSMTLGEEQFAGWVDEEPPSRALQFLGLAGSSVLLMPPLHQDVRRLRENPEYRRSSDDWIAAGYFPVIGATSVGDHQDHQYQDDPGGLDLDAIDVGGFDSHSDASSAIDSGLSGGGFWGDGGSGGHGSGGDGGGGWGDGGGGGWGGDGGGGFGGGDGGGGGGGG